jgi:hypothetical protein
MSKIPREVIEKKLDIDSSYEGPEKTTRGGGEWEPIKISHRNSAYVPKLTLTHLSFNSTKTV